MEQRYIQKKDILYKLLTKWKYILLWACVGAVAGGLLGCLFAYNFDYSTSYLKKIALEYEKKLSDDEIEAVNQLFKDEKEVLERYADDVGYKYQSVIAQLDHEAVDTVYLIYALNGSEADLIIYTDIIAQYLVSDEVIAEAVTSLNRSIYRNYVRQLLQISFSDDRSAMTIRIQGTNKRMCNLIADVLKAQLKKNLAEELQTELAEAVAVEFVEQRFAREYSDSVLQAQMKRSSSLSEAEEEMRRVEEGLNEKQRNYFYAVFANKKNVSQIYSDNVNTGYYRLRYSLLGIVLSVLIASICIVIQFFFSKNLRSVNELLETRQLPLLGIIVRRKSRKKKLVNRIYGQHGEGTKAYIMSQIKENARQQGIDQLLVISSSPQNMSKCAYIAKWINESEELHAFTEEGLHEDLETNTFGIILLEIVEKALYEQISDMLNIYEERNQIVVGYIAMII